MYGKAVTILFSGLLFACVQAPPPPAPPPPPPVPAPPPAAAAETPAGDRTVAIRRVPCGRLLELSQEDRSAASLFYIGYAASRSGSATINVNKIPAVTSLALDYCAAYPGRPAAEAFARAYADVRRW